MTNRTVDRRPDRQLSGRRLTECINAAQTAAGARALRKRARKVADRRPPSGLVPVRRIPLPVTADLRPVPRGWAMGRWERLSTTLTVVGVIIVVVSVALAAPGSIHTESVVVARGDTLWSIAERAQPHADPLTVVEDIKSRNHLSGDRLTVGRVLEVPTRDEGE